MRLALPILLSSVFSGCFAELTAGPGFASGGAGGVGFSVGAVVGIHYDIGSMVKVGLGGEYRGNKTLSNNETFVQNHRGLTLLTDTALAASYDSHSLKTLRLRLGAGWAPDTTLSLTPSLTGKTYRPPLIGQPGSRDAVETPHTTWSGIAGLSFDVTGSVIGYALGLEGRVDSIHSEWMGDVLFVTPQVRATFFVTIDGMTNLFNGLSASSIVVPPPPAWLNSNTGPKPDTSHSDDDIRKSQQNIEEQRRLEHKRCQGGGGCN